MKKPGELIRIVREDREDIFKNKKMSSQPDINFRDLFLKKIQGKTWKQIAEEDYRELGVKQSALTNFFWDRCIDKDRQIKPIIEKYFKRQKRKPKKSK